VCVFVCSINNHKTKNYEDETKIRHEKLSIIFLMNIFHQCLSLFIFPWIGFETAQFLYVATIDADSSTKINITKTTINGPNHNHRDGQDLLLGENLTLVHRLRDSRGLS
jgi:hypothetical protein